MARVMDIQRNSSLSLKSGGCQLAAHYLRDKSVYDDLCECMVGLTCVEQL